jgi:hypothetical protein
MENMQNEIMKKRTVREIVEQRDRTLNAWYEVVHVARAARDAQRLLATERGHLIDVQFDRRITLNDEDGQVLRWDTKDQLRKTIDTQVWRILAEEAGLYDLMDATAKKDFSNQIMENPPPVTLENVAATFARLQEEKPIIFERGVLKVFRSLSKNYQTNDPFQIGKRIITHWWQYNNNDDVADLERIIHILDGKRPPEYMASISNQLSASRGRGERSVDTEYFSCYLYKNNNLHITFKRLDLIDRVNAIIARNLGPAVADRTRSKKWKKSVGRSSNPS